MGKGNYYGQTTEIIIEFATSDNIVQYSPKMKFPQQHNNILIDYNDVQAGSQLFFAFTEIVIINGNYCYNKCNITITKERTFL